MEMEAHPLTWQSHTFQAMGSHILLWLDTADKTAASRAFVEVETLFAANEQALSRFQPDSELSRLNARSGEWVLVSDLLWSQITMAVQMAAMTNGRFDPTLLNALQLAGYDRSFTMMSGGGWNEQAGKLVLQGCWAGIEFAEALRAVRVPAGVQIDLGGIAKGDTAQQAVAALRTVGPCLVDAGGDLVAGAAPWGFPGWPVAISLPGADAHDEGQDLAALWLAEGTMATSGTDYRRWVQDGQAMHHLIDPFTGSPAAADGLAVTVLAGEAAVAEAWATATLVAGSAAGMDTLLDHDLAGLFVTQNGRILLTPHMDLRLQGQL